MFRSIRQMCHAAQKIFQQRLWATSIDWNAKNAIEPKRLLGVFPAWSLRSISKINILNCFVYLSRKEIWHVIKIRALVMSNWRLYDRLFSNSTSSMSYVVWLTLLIWNLSYIANICNCKLTIKMWPTNFTMVLYIYGMNLLWATEDYTIDRFETVLTVCHM